jgi:hypothetical protein
MGALMDKVKLALLVNGDGVPDNFKKNSLFFYDKYMKSDNDIKNINVSNIKPGGFYFFHYKDDSNWMKWAPVYVIEFKKFNNQIVLLCVNFNFLPLEIRVLLFDKFILEDDFEKDKLLNLKVNYRVLYQELKRIGFEWALMEFNAIQLVAVHKISMNTVPRFLYHQHPKNKYDPGKLVQIWKAKLATAKQRDQEITSASLDEFYNIDSEISEKYDVLKDHIKRIRANMIKYGKS